MSKDKLTPMIEDMGGGIDRRTGAVNRDSRGFYDLVNFQTTPGRKLKRRVPCTKLTGVLATNNCFYLNGKVTAFSRYGTTVTHTVSGLIVATQVLYFDPPIGDDWATGGFTDTVIEAVSLNGTVCALVEHVTAGGRKQILLHVFDQTPDAVYHAKRFATYVGDGATPPYWLNQYPQAPYGKDEPGSSSVYGVRMCVDGSRIYISMANGNVAYCAVNRPRVWNLRTAAQILQDGRWIYLPPAVSTASINFPIDIPYTHLTGPNGANYRKAGGYAEFTLEVFSSGRWLSLVYSPLVGTQGTFGLAADASAALGTFTEGTRLSYCVYTALVGRPMRFSARARGAVAIVDGCLVREDGSISSGSITWQGRQINVPEILRTAQTDLYTASLFARYVGFRIAGTIDAPVFVWACQTEVPRDGMVICGYVLPYVSNPAGGGNNFLTGTVSAIGTAVTGVGTAFKTAFGVPSPPGVPPVASQWIGVSNGEIRRVISVASDTTLTVDRAFTYAVSSIGYMVPGGVYLFLPGTYQTVAGSNQVRCVIGAAVFGEDGLCGATVTFGYKAIVLFVDEVNGILTMDTPATATAIANDAVYTPVYAPEYSRHDNVGTKFWQDREAEALLAAGVNATGVADAGYLGSAQYEGGAQLPVALASGQNRLFIQYAQAIQMWGNVGTTAPLYLARQEIGAGLTPKPKPVMIDDGLMVPTEFGPRIFSPAGNAKDYIVYSPVGDTLNRVVLPQFQAAAWWQNQSVLVTAGTDLADGTLWVFSYNKAAQVSGWGKWTIYGLTGQAGVGISKLIVAVGTLLVISGTSVYQFNPAATSFRDSVDPAGAGNAYASYARWNYLDFGRPRNNKKLTRLEVQSVGQATYDFYVEPYDTTDKVTTPPVVSGYTVGTGKWPLLVLGSAIAPALTTTDETGFELFALGFDYIPLRR